MAGSEYPPVPPERLRPLPVLGCPEVQGLGCRGVGPPSHPSQQPAPPPHLGDPRSRLWTLRPQDPARWPRRPLMPESGQKVLSRTSVHTESGAERHCPESPPLPVRAPETRPAPPPVQATGSARSSRTRSNRSHPRRARLPPPPESGESGVPLLQLPHEKGLAAESRLSK